MEDKIKFYEIANILDLEPVKEEEKSETKEDKSETKKITVI